MTGSVRVPVVRVRDGRHVESADLAAAEVPLEVRLGGRAFSILMRTPGADRALVAGFLLSERLIRSADDLATIEHCTDLPDEAVEAQPWLYRSEGFVEEGRLRESVRVLGAGADGYDSLIVMSLLEPEHAALVRAREQGGV